MKTLAALALAAALAHNADASGISIALDPVNGAVSGNPGDTVGWGFTLTNGSAYYIAIDSVAIENETSPVSGAGPGFTSYMDVLGGFTNGATPPGGTWALEFLQGNPGNGVGQYAIDPGTAPGASDS